MMTINQNTPKKSIFQLIFLEINQRLADFRE